MESYNPDEALKLRNQLCFPLYTAARKRTQEYTPFLKPLGLTYTQYIVMLVLWEKDGITVGELGRELMLDNGTLTPLLKKLETAGIITRTRRREDERQVILNLTEEGRELKKTAREVPLKLSGCVKLNPDEAMQLYQLLYKIIQ